MKKFTLWLLVFLGFSCEGTIQETLGPGDIVSPNTVFLAPDLTFQVDGNNFCVVVEYPAGGPATQTVCVPLPTQTVTDTITDTIVVEVPVQINDRCLRLGFGLVKYRENANQYWVGFDFENDCNTPIVARLEVEKTVASPINSSQSQHVFLSDDLGPVTQNGLVTTTEGILDDFEEKRVGADLFVGNMQPIYYRGFEGTELLFTGRFVSVV